jgi:hypothetical protein
VMTTGRICYLTVMMGHFWKRKPDSKHSNLYWQCYLTVMIGHFWKRKPDSKHSNLYWQSDA